MTQERVCSQVSATVVNGSATLQKNSGGTSGASASELSHLRTMGGGDLFIPVVICERLLGWVLIFSGTSRILCLCTGWVPVARNSPQAVGIRVVVQLNSVLG